MRALFLDRYASQILYRTGEHLILVVIAITIALAIGIPLGILITRKPNLAKPVLGFANAVQTIPSLAIFGFLISVPLLGGIGRVPAIVALTLYALLPLIRNTYTGIVGVDPAIREAGKGMGMTERQILFQVEIPLALGVILTGVRIATVICVGIATIAAAIGGGGLGVFIFRGISTVDNNLILAGAIPAAIIALGADWFLGWVENSLKGGQGKKILNRQFAIRLGIFTFLTVGLVAIYQQTAQVSGAGGTVTIGSKNFTEQIILGELLAQHIEAETDLNVDRQLDLGGSFILHKAVKDGEIAGYVEYTGTAFTAILEREPIKDPQEIYQQVKQAYDEEFDLEVMPSLGFENTYAILVRQEDAERYNLKTISDVAQYTPQWQGGFYYEFLERADGLPGLAETYGLKFGQPPREMEFGLMYKALAEGEVDLIAGNSTDGLIQVLDLVQLQDDKKYFPPYEAVPVFNQEVLEEYPQVEEAVSQLTGLISVEEMQRMNYLVDNESRPAAEVVQEFRETKGL